MVDLREVESLLAEVMTGREHLAEAPAWSCPCPGRACLLMTNCEGHQRVNCPNYPDCHEPAEAHGRRTRARRRTRPALLAVTVHVAAAVRVSTEVTGYASSPRASVCSQSLDI